MQSSARTALLAGLVCLLVSGMANARQNLVSNGSMESGAGPDATDPRVPLDWVRFGNLAAVERSGEANVEPPDGGFALKAFSSDSTQGAYQDVAVTAGQEVTIACQMYTRGTDKIGGDAQAGIVLEFYNSSEQLVDLVPLIVMDAGSPADTWIPASIGPETVPSGAVTARMVCFWRWFGNASGSAYWDDCVMTIDGGANVLSNPDFELAGQGDQSPTGIDDWTGFNDQQQTTDAAWDGQASLQLGSSMAFAGLFQDMGVLEAGDQIRLVARAMIPSGNPLDGDAQVGIKLEFDPPAGIEIPPPEENLPFTEDATTNAWQTVELETTVPADMNIARLVMIYVGDQDTTGSVYFDLAEATVNGGANLLFNPSFEDGPGGEDGIDDWSEFGTAEATARKNCFNPDVQTEPPDGGDCTVKATGPAVAGIFQEIGVSPGDTLNIQARLFTPGGDKLTGANAAAGVKVEWAPGSIPGDIDIGGSNNTITSASDKDVWHELKIDYTMPVGTTATARFTNIIVRGTASQGVAYVDGCEAVVFNKFDGADADADDDADLRDFMYFQQCYLETVSDGWPCLVFDSDDNGSIEIADYEYFGQRLTGP